MQPQRKLQAIRQTLGQEQITKGHEVVFLCPKCQHRKPKLSVNLITDKFHCWVCNYSGQTLVPLFPKGSSERKEYVAEVQEKNPLRDSAPVEKYDVPVLPQEFRSLSQEWRSPYCGMIRSYLRERGIDREDILRWKLGYCEDGEYKNRVVIPSFDEYGHLNFFVGRAIFPNMLKYKHGNFDKDIVFNDYMVDWERPIVITEGPFDAFKAATNVVPLQGSILNQGSKLFSKIVLSEVDVFFAMDRDAFDKQLTIIQNLFSYGVTCHYVDLGKRKDVGEMSKDEFQKAKAGAMPVTCDADLLRLRVSH